MEFDDMEMLIEKQRSKSHMKSYTCMAICGLALIIGGGSFFLYESIITEEDHKSSMDSNFYELTEKQNEELRKDDEVYAGEFRYAAISFVSVGALLFLVGTLMACTQYKRIAYLSVSDNQSPIMKRSFPNGKQDPDRMPKAQLPKNEKKLYSPKSKSWFWRKKLTGDEFRLGINHHPSFNLVPIEELAGLSHWSPGRSYERRASITKERTSMSSVIRKFFRLPKRADGNECNDVDFEIKKSQFEDTKSLDENQRLHSIESGGVSNPLCYDGQLCDSDNDDDSLVAYGGDVSSLYEDDR